MADNNMKKISLGAYHVISKIAGCETDIIRRQSQFGIMDMISRQLDLIRFYGNGYYVNSGSRAEGLAFSTSDMDTMCILTRLKVKESCTQLLEFDQGAFLLMENSVTRPGFCFLRVSESSPSHPMQFCMKHTCSERIGDVYYLSNTKFKNLMFDLYRRAPSEPLGDAHLHGPCISGNLFTMETDFAFSPWCENWPTMANNCILRLLRRGWPSYGVIERIIQGGCLFVAVGSKGSQFEHLEWRISFSLAEKELVHSMNHIQIMCYACLKIFLKEAINAVEPVKDLFCSYFLKTAVFWEIIEGHEEWTAESFLQWFWKCFTRLIGWVSNGYCPNFFIPENNMFLGKIHGQSREQLLHHLSDLYSEGYKCLLRCISIRDSLITVIERPTLILQQTQSSIQDKAYTDVKLIETALNLYDAFSCYTLSQEIVTIGIIRHIMKIRSHDIYRILCKLTLQEKLSYIVFSLLLNVGDRYCFKNKLLCKLLRCMERSTLDAVRFQVFMALFFLRHQMYDEALCSVHIAMLRLQNPLMMYGRDKDESRYRAAGGNHIPLHVMMRRYVVSNVYLTSHTCMPELFLECVCLGPYSTLFNLLLKPWVILLPPLVLLHFLKFLSYHHKSDRQSAQSVLNDLFTLVCHGDGDYIPMLLLPISHEILGICQEMHGDYQGALSSYIAVRSNPLSEHLLLRYASEVRIRGLLEKMR